MKRDLSDELKDGFSALQAEREGKIILRQYEVEKNLHQQLRQKSYSSCARSCTCPAQCLPDTCAPTSAHSKTGNKAVPAQTRRLQY
jgi:hypothetical protein